MSPEHVRPARTLGFRLASAASPAPPVGELLAGAFYHRWIMLAALLVPVLLGLAAASAARTMYVGEARLLVLYGSEFVYASSGRTGGSVVLDRNQVILGELQILQSSELAAETLQSVGPARVYPGPVAGGADQAVERFAKDLTVTSIPQSNVITLSFRNRDPGVVVDVLTTLIAHYLTRRTAVFERPSLREAEARHAALQAALDAAETALAEFARVHGITNLDQQISLLLTQSFNIAASQREVAAAISEAQAKLAVVRQKLAATPPRIRVFSEVQRSQQAHAATDALMKAQAELAALQTHFGPNAPEVREREDQVAAIQEKLRHTPAREGDVERDGENPFYNEYASRATGLEADLEGLRARRADLDAAAAALTRPLADLNLAAPRYGELKRQRDVLDDAYRTFSRDLGQARAAEAIERSPQANIRVLQPPERPGFGQNPRKLLAAGGVALGLLCAAAVLALLHVTRPILLSAREAERALALPVLAVVPLKSARRRAAAMGRLAAPAWSSLSSSTNHSQ